MTIPVPTLRRWMLAAHLWSAVRKTKRSHRRRSRRAHFGELVQLDGSFHDWFETGDVGPCLLTMIDDATGRTLGTFTAGETTWGAADLLQRWIAQHGVPQALYVDAKNVFVRPGTVNELAAGIAPVTQFGRMGAKLGIRVKDKVTALKVFYVGGCRNRFFWLKRHDAVDECALAITVCLWQLEGTFSIDLAPVCEKQQMIK